MKFILKYIWWIKIFEQLTLSLPNETVVEFTVHCQTQLQSKFKGTVDSSLFLKITVIRDANLCLYFKMFSGHNNIVRNFSWQEWNIQKHL